jgi:hypothetical protein
VRWRGLALTRRAVRPSVEAVERSTLACRSSARVVGGDDDAVTVRLPLSPGIADHARTCRRLNPVANDLTLGHSGPVGVSECTSAVGSGRGQALDGSVSHDDEQDSDETTDQE